MSGVLQAMLIAMFGDDEPPVPPGGDVTAGGDRTIQNTYGLSTARAGVRYLDNGRYGPVLAPVTPTAILSWVVTGVAADYLVRATVLSGALAGGSDATGVWLGFPAGPPNDGHQWWAERVTPGTSTAVITIDIADLSENILDSATITLRAIRT